MKINGTKILVTGACGFLGSHVVDELISQGAHVTAFDMYQNSNLNPLAQFAMGTLDNIKLIEKLTEDIDYVYHFAAIADIGEATSQLNKVIQTNILGSTFLIQACIKNKVKVFNFASTVYVYSDKGSFYRISKQCVESLLEELAKNDEIEYRILRYGSIYGPRSQDWNGLKKYITQAYINNEVELKSNGSAKREYIHVLDAAQLSVQALDSTYKNKSLIITGSQSITANELIETISEILNKKIKIKYNDSQTADHYVLTPYKYLPKLGIKITNNQYRDFGQGLLEIIDEVVSQKTE